MVRVLQINDREFIERIKRREQQALAELYAAYGQTVYNMAMQISRSEAAAQAMTQAMFSQIWHNPDSWNPQKGRLLSWLLVMIRYRAIDYLRQEQTRPARHSITLEDFMRLLDNRQTQGVSQQDLQHLLRVYMKTLPDEQRQVLNLAFFRGMTHAEIAEHLRLSPGVVKGRIRLAMKKLRDAWVTEIAAPEQRF